MANSDEPKPGPQVSSIRAIVRIQTPPELNPTTGEIEPGLFIGFDTAARDLDINRALLSVTTSKNLGEPCGRATLTFAPDKYRGRTWADMIPSYSLIEIFLQRFPENPQPILVFLGLTDAREVSETYQRDGSVQRSVKVSARELSCLFVDWRTLYLPTPPENLYRDSATNLPGLFTEKVQLLGMLALEPHLALTGEDPAKVIGKFVQMVTTGLETEWNPKALPLINLELPYDRQMGRPPRRLADYLVYDEESARRDLFDPTAQLPASSQFTLSDHSLWNLIETFSDPVYQELFTQTLSKVVSIPGPVDAQPPRDASFVEVVFRKKPFGGRLNAKGEFDMTSIRDTRGSQFDREFEGDPLNTFEITDRDVMQMVLRRSPEDLLNLYYVIPQVPDLDVSDWQAQFPPLIDDADGSPSSITRYGLRMLRHADYYFGQPRSSSDPPKEDPLRIETGRSRAKMLYYWYRFNPLFHRGSYNIRGNALARVGMRMVHQGRDLGPEGTKGKREYYVTAVTHSMQFAQEVLFTTALSVERGWPIRN